MPRLKPVSDWYGVRTGWHQDPVTGASTLYSEQNVTAILARNKEAQNGGRHDNALGRCLASIPVTVFHGWLDSAGMNMQTWGKLSKPERRKFLARKLNDPDNAYLKTTTKRIFAR